jgi:hypothetical protein
VEVAADGVMSLFVFVRNGKQVADVFTSKSLVKAKRFFQPLFFVL